MTYFENKFAALARAVELAENEQAVAKFFFYAGLKTALKQQTSVSALVKPVVKAKATEPSEKLNQAEIQFLSEMTRYVLNILPKSSSSLNGAIDFYYENSDKDRPQETADYFKNLKKFLSAKAKLKDRTKRLSVIQRKLKKLQKVA